MENPYKHNFSGQLLRAVRPRGGELFDFEIMPALNYYSGTPEILLSTNRQDLDEEELDRCFFNNDNAEQTAHKEWKEVNKELFNKTKNKKNYRVCFPIKNGKWVKC